MTGTSPFDKLKKCSHVYELSLKAPHLPLVEDLQVLKSIYVFDSLKLHVIITRSPLEKPAHLKSKMSG